MGSANEYHKEEVSQVKKQNNPSSRYYLSEPEVVAEIFDRGGLLKKYQDKHDASLEAKLMAIEKALTKNLDEKGKNAVAKLQSKEFKKFRSRVAELKKEQRSEEYKTYSDEYKAKASKELWTLQAKLNQVKEPVIGRDFTLTLEKSYSIAFALSSPEDKQIWINIFKESARQTLEMIVQEYMRSNNKGATKKEIKDALDKAVYALYIHFQNRDGDPHLHAHGVVYNLLKELDGDRLKGNNFPIMQGENFQKFCKKADLFLHSKMNEGLQKEFKNKYSFTPYKMEKSSKKPLEEKDGAYILDGWDIAFDEPSKKAIKNLSKLSQKVNEEVREKIQEAREDRDVNLAIVKQKFSDNPERLEIEIAEVKAKFENTKKYFETDWAKKRQIEVKPAKGTRAGSFEEISSTLNLQAGSHLDLGGLEKFTQEFDAIVDHFTQTKHNFTELDLELCGLKYGAPLSEVKSQISRILNRSKDKDGHRKYVLNDGNWFSRKNLLMAYEVVRASQDLASSRQEQAFTRLTFEQHQMLRQTFNSDQVEAIKLCLNDRQLNIIAGLPGVGKSTVLKQVVKEMHKQNPNIQFHKLATAGKIVDQLATDIDTGEASTLEAFYLGLKSQKIELNKNSVVIVDEAGMVEDKHFQALFQEAKRAGAKVILVGDDRQLSSVGRGDSFSEILAKNKSQTVRINEIVRQKNAKLKETVELLAGSGVSDDDYKKKAQDNSLVKEALKDLEDKNMVKTFTRSRDLYEDLAASYVNSPEALKDKLVIASSNNEVSKINNAIQDLLFKDKTGVPFISLEDSDLSFFVGDRVLMTKQVSQKIQEPDPENPGKAISKTKKVSNGKLATVLSVNPAKKTITLEFETDGIKKIEVIDVEKYADSLSLGYCATTHRSQGVSIDSVMIALSDNEILNSVKNLNVAISRGKHKCEVYMLGQHKDKIIESHRANTRLENLIQNTKQNFFEEEDLRKEMLEQERQAASSKELERLIAQAHSFGFEMAMGKINQRYQFNGKSLDVASTPEQFVASLQVCLGEEVAGKYISLLNQVEELNVKLFDQKSTPPEVELGTYPKDSLKLPSPAKDIALSNLIELYSKMDVVPGVKVQNLLKLKKELEKMMTKPIPQDIEKVIEKPLIR